MKANCKNQHLFSKIIPLADKRKRKDGTRVAKVSLFTQIKDAIIIIRGDIV